MTEEAQYILLELPTTGVTAKKAFDQLGVMLIGNLKDCVAMLIGHTSEDSDYFSANAKTTWFDDGDVAEIRLNYVDSQYLIKYAYTAEGYK